MGEPVSVLRRIGNWFGLTGTYEPKAGGGATALV